VRILFQLPYAGYLRIYGSTIRLLAERGNEVLLAYDGKKEKGAEAVEQFLTSDRIREIGRVPWRPDRRRRLLSALRRTVDYLRYCDPRFDHAPYLRRRMEKYVPRRVLLVLLHGRLPRPVARILVRAAVALDRRIGASPDAIAFLQRLEASPDAIVVSPAFARGPSGVRQTETIKAAKALGIPVAIGVASWDHLTTKGLIKAQPDRVLVWNEIQRREAVELHGVPADRVVITGAQLFDQWFGREPTETRERFLASVGLDPARPYVLYVGSSPNISPPEREEAFVRRWISALRGAGSPLKELGVLVRPHPGNADHWGAVELSELGGTIAPRARPAIPMTEADEELYFHSIAFAEAVVGVNTSAIIESLIQRRPVFTIQDGTFSETQEGTLHFHYLLPGSGGCVLAASSIDHHLEQLQDAITDPTRHLDSIETFLRSFVRPGGLERSATELLAAEIESMTDAPAADGRNGATRAPSPSPVHPNGNGPASRRRPQRSDFEIDLDPLVRRFGAEAPPDEVARLIEKRRRTVSEAVAGHRTRASRRTTSVVADTYEEHYAQTNADYFETRRGRRGVYVVDGRPVYVTGWFAIGAHVELFDAIIGATGAQSVLEVGSGRGTNLALLALRRPENRHCGVELTAAGVERGRELVADPPHALAELAGLPKIDDDERRALRAVEFIRADATTLPFDDGEFDLSYTSLVLEQIPRSYPAVVREMARVTRRYCVFLEPFREANSRLGRDYLASLDYFRASFKEFGKYGLRPVHFSTMVPQKLHFGSAVLVAERTLKGPHRPLIHLLRARRHASPAPPAVSR
jgi:SAM-dependent methyltransferase